MGVAMRVAVLEMRRPVRVIQWPEALFCHDCNAVVSAPADICPACASAVLLRLRDLLPQMSWESEQGVPVLGIGEGR
jgi:rRNA maturation endonuclease Nob1